MRSTVTLLCASVAFALLLAPSLAPAQSAPPAKPLKPDLHGGGARPNTIPNHEVTDVVLPGFHFIGSEVTSTPQCKIVSQTVASDNEIRLKIEGTRTLNDEETCDLKVTNAAGHATLWIVVDLTADEQQQLTARQNAAAAAKTAAFLDRSGKIWRLHFDSGATLTYTRTGVTQDAMPEFQSSTGNTVHIAVSDDNTVVIVESGCMRSGKLTGAEVKNGESRGDCTPSGVWSAIIEK